MLWISKLKALSFHSLGVTHLFLGEYPLYENSISLWQSCSENFMKICRKGYVTEIIVSISCQLWKFLHQLFQRTPSNRCFHFSDVIFLWNMQNMDGAWQLKLNGSECLMVKQWQRQTFTQSSQDGCKSASILNVFVSLKQPPIWKHTNLNTFALLLRQWQTDVTQTSPEKYWISDVLYFKFNTSAVLLRCLSKT